MKKIICALFLCLLLISCNRNDDILSYQNGDISARCIINGEYEVDISKKGDVRELKIVSPSSLDNISFVYDSGSWSAICDDIKIPLNADELDGICALASIFDLDKSAISTAYDTDGVGIVSFDMNEICYTVTYNGLSLPERIKITSDTLDFDVEIASISIADKNDYRQ